MNDVIDKTMGRRPIRQILADLDTLDDRILEQLHGTHHLPATVVALDRGTGQGPKPDRVRAWRAD